MYDRVVFVIDWKYVNDFSYKRWFEGMFFYFVEVWVVVEFLYMLKMKLKILKCFLIGDLYVVVI